MTHDNGYSNKQPNHSREGTHSPYRPSCNLSSYLKWIFFPSFTLFQNDFLLMFYFGAKYIIGLIYSAWTFLHNPIMKK
jgi:hypothetical protein